MKFNSYYRQYRRLKPERFFKPLDPGLSFFWPLADTNWPRALLPQSILFGLITTASLFHMPHILWTLFGLLYVIVLILTSGYYWQMMGHWLTDGPKAKALPWPWLSPSGLEQLFIAGLKVTLFVVVFLLPLRLWTLLLASIPLPLAHLDDLLVQAADVLYVFLTPYAMAAIVAAARTQKLADLFDGKRILPICKAHYATSLKAVAVGGALMCAGLPFLMFFGMCCGPILGIIPAFWMAFGAHLATQVFAQAENPAPENS